MDKQKIKLFRLKEESNKNLEIEVGKIMDELNEFFGLDWTENLPKVIFLESREQIDQFYGQKTENWVVGWSGKNQTVYLLDQEKTGIESKRKYDEKEYRALIKHEFTHAFYSILTGYTHCPVWLNEGVSIYISGQLEFKKKIGLFKNFLTFYDKGGAEIYAEAGWVIKLLVEKFGKGKLLTLLAEIKANKPDEEGFKKMFAAVYEIELNYEFFNTSLGFDPSA